MRKEAVAQAGEMIQALRTRETQLQQQISPITMALCKLSLSRILNMFKQKELEYIQILELVNQVAHRPLESLTSLKSDLISVTIVICNNLLLQDLGN